MEKTTAMSRPHPLTSLSEREWAQAWEAEQRALDGLSSQRGSWLPNVVEIRDWGAVRWTSGRPGHAALTGRAHAESFAVLRPDLHDRATRKRILEALRERPPVRRVLGFGLREYHIRGAVRGMVAVAVLAAVIVAVLGVGWYLVPVAAVVGAGAGAVVGVGVMHIQMNRQKAEILGDREQVRIVPGLNPEPAWIRLIEAATLVAVQQAGHAESDQQARDAVHSALWEAAGLLLHSSDHTGVEVLADGVARLAQAERG